MYTISDPGAGFPHSFTPAKSGIIITKTVDTRVPQEEFSIDKLDGTGPTGYNIDLTKIQMAYIDYSWYGAGKIRYGFKTRAEKFNTFTSLSTITLSLSHTSAQVTCLLVMK
jgi:hypothetical protein